MKKKKISQKISIIDVWLGSKYAYEKECKETKQLEHW